MRRLATTVVFLASLVGVVVVPAAAQRESPPTLLRPTLDQRIPQNDPSSGCEFNPKMGYGSRLDLDWTDVDGAVAYDVWMSKTGARFPIVDTSVRESSLTRPSCGWVADSNLDNWEWRVRARYADGHAGPWSETVRVHFAPCRFDDGVPCQLVPRDGNSTGALPSLEEADRAASAVTPDAEGFSPPDRTVFRHYPRKTVFTWPAAANAAAYEIEVNWWGGDKDGWIDQAAKGFPPHRMTEPRYETYWIGAQPGRWRTRTIGADGQAGPWTPWRTFNYKR
jgi:hypothetical protein